ncbi:uncharacterized protein [Henckelia pumila]|uniref:uncharacterized protein n=1 Tax=Henckelia pumila TaxID=405737 RepID=UPI003C6DDB01
MPKNTLKKKIKMAITSDFRFWEESVPIHRQSPGDYIEFRVQKHHDHDQDESSTTDSPPLWTKTPKNSTAKSPLLPHDHHYSSCLSPASRSRAILEGKRELMEMIKDLPESSLELSLKDMVEDHAEVMKEVVLVEEIKKTNSNHKIGKRIIHNNKKNTTIASSKICRTESMESGVFLLKMFLPASLISSKKRSDSRKWPTDHNIGPPPPPPEGSEKSQASSRWWKITFLFLRDYKNRRHIGGNINSEMNNRLNDGSCQWWLCFHRKCRSSGQRGCLLF